MSSPVSRRTILARSLAATVAAGIIPNLVAGAEPMPSMPTVNTERSGGSMLKPAVNAYSFLELLQAGSMDPAKGIDLFAVCEFAARLNLAAVDLTGYFFPGYPAPPSAEYIVRLKRHLHHLGLDLSGTGVRNDFATADAAVRAAGVGLVKQWIEVAARLGAPVIRVFAGPQGPHKDWQQAAAGSDRQAVEGWMADALRECAEAGKAQGVLVAVQNHGDFLSTGAQHLSLLQRVGHDWCGALVDTGKYLTEDPYADIALMAPHAFNWQIKETMASSQQSPAVDFAKLVSVIRASVYRGYVPIETLAMGRKDYDPYREVTAMATGLRSAIAASPL